MLLHLSRFETKERVEKIVRIATQQRAGQTNNSVSARCQRTQRISLRGIARELMDLVANRVVKPFLHVAPNELDRCHTADLVRIRLPERAVQWAARLLSPGLNGLGNFDFLEFTCRQAAVVHDHRLARIRIHHASNVWARARYPVSMAPEVTQLGSLTSDNK